MIAFIKTIFNAKVFKDFDDKVLMKLANILISVSQSIADDAKKHLRWAVYTFDNQGRVVGVSGGGRATGRLANSITYEIDAKKNSLTSRVGTNVDYAKYVEFGTEPRFVSFRNKPYLMLWAARHGFDVMTRGGLKVTGRAIPFLRPALEKNKENIKRRFEQLTL